MASAMQPKPPQQMMSALQHLRASANALKKDINDRQKARTSADTARLSLVKMPCCTQWYSMCACHVPGTACNAYTAFQLRTALSTRTHSASQLALSRKIVQKHSQHALQTGGKPCTTPVPPGVSYG